MRFLFAPAIAAALLATGCSRLDQARNYSEKKDYAKAEEIYRSILKTDPGNAEVKRLLASVLFRENKLGEAADVLGGVPASQQARNQANLLSQARRFTEQQEYGKAEMMYRSILKDNPDDAEVKRLLASVVFRQNRIDEATAILNSIAPPPADRPDRAVLDQARDLVHKRKFAKAEAIYRSILKTNPDDVEVKRMLASAVFRQGKIAEAAKIINSIGAKKEQP